MSAASDSGQAYGNRTPFGDPVIEGSIAFVPPRFGDGVIGGAEAVLAEAAIGLAARGHSVEILTTCAKDHFTWANEFPSGVSRHGEGPGSVLVRRFPVEMDTPGVIRDRVGDRILAGNEVSIQDQQRWMNDSLRSSGLWDHVFDHGERYRALVFAPYMFWTTFAVSQIHPQRSIIMPCLHDEPPAYLELFTSMMEGAAGLWFLTDPERDLASRIYRLGTQQTIVGASVEVPDSYDPGRFRSDFGIEGPYVYYGGRREWGKGWDDLLHGFYRYVQERPGRPVVKLVTSGVGVVQCPPGSESHIVDVGLLSDEQRDNAMAGAVAYLQPSAMESFSRTVLEALAAGTPVVANRASDVVSWHLANSGGGLTYEGEAELVQCLNFITDEPLAAAELACDGRRYVSDRYRLPLVLDRMEASLDQWMPLAEGSANLPDGPSSLSDSSLSDADRQRTIDIRGQSQDSVRSSQ
ncbi:MAG: glycosyltransferase family 4 protein [Acidimicrobiales bacterium]